MRRAFLPGLLALALISFFSTPAQAQVGMVTGSVFDQNGMPLKGVKVTAKSPTDIAPKTAYTDADGLFRIIGLMPGTFTVTAVAKGLKPFSQVLKIKVAQPVDVTIMLEVDTGETDVVVVKPKPPTVNVTSAATVETFDEEFLDALPLADRTNVQGVLANQVAGAVGSSSSPQFRGGTSTQNVYQLEGFQVNDVGGGQGQLITQTAVAALDVQTGGYGAENANAAGAVMNAVTKSGSNRFEIDVTGYHENRYLQAFRDELDNKNFSMHSQIAVNLSGPIVKDRLWFFTTLEGRNRITGLPTDLVASRPTPPQYSFNSFKSTGKLTFQVTPRNKLQGVYIFNRSAVKNGQQSYDYDADSQNKIDNLDFFGGLIWESMLTDSLLFRSQVGVQSYNEDNGPEICRTDPERCDHISPLRQFEPFREFQNWNTHRLTRSKTLEFKNSLEYFINSKALGDHSIKLTGRFFAAELENSVSTPNDKIYVFDGLEPHSKRTLFVNDPTQEPGRFGWAIATSTSRLIQASLQDQIKFPGYRYLTFTPGVGFFIAKSTDAFGNDVTDFTTATPHISAAWDVTHDGRTVVRAGFNQYVDAGNLQVANYLSSTRTLQVCQWDPVTETFGKNCNFQDGQRGRTVGKSCGPSGIGLDGKPCDEKLEIPRTWEYTLGVEREVVQGVSLGVDLQYRDYKNQYETRETNLIWNAAGTELDPTGGFRNGERRSVFNLETPEGAKRQYIGVLTKIVKREGKLKLNFTYQWSMLRGNVVNGFVNDYLDNPAQDKFMYGYLPGDSRHAVRAQSVYSWNAWFSTGLTYAYDSGTPLSPVYYNPVWDADKDFRARRGFHPGLDIADPRDDYEWRIPDRQQLSLQARVNFKPITRFNAELWVDMFNLLALRTTTSFETRFRSKGFGQPNGRLDPAQARIGFRIKY